MHLVFVCIHSVENSYICVYNMFIYENCLYNVSNNKLHDSILSSDTLHIVFTITIHFSQNFCLSRSRALSIFFEYKLSNFGLICQSNW